MIPARFAPALFGLILSGVMSCLVSGVATLRATGVTPTFLTDWMQAWAFGWAVAFPTVLVVAPFVRRLVAKLTVAGPS